MKFRPLLLLPFLPLLNSNALAADGTWTGTSSGAWLTAGNWSATPGSSSLTTNTDIATFNVATQPTVGINMNSTSGNYYLGALDYASSTARNIGNSSSALAGVLTLNGATVNSVANTILRNSSTGLLTLQAAQSGGGTMGLALGNSTNNVIQITGTGGIAISSIISGSGNKLTLQGGGTGSLTLSGANTYSGGTTITSGGLNDQSAGAINLGNASALGTGDVTFNNTAAITGLYFQSGFGTASTLANNITFTSSGVMTRLLNTAGISQVVTLSGKLSGGSSTSSIRIDNTAGSGVARIKLTNATNDVTLSVWEMWRGGLEFTSDAALGNANNDLKLNVGASSDPTGTGLIFGADNITLNANRSLDIADRTNIDTQAFTGSQINGAITFTNTLVKKGSTTLTLNGTGTGTGGIRIDAGTVQVGTGSTTGTIGTGNVAFNASGTKLVINRSDALTISGNITGAGSVEKQGAGTTTLSGSASTYSGGTTISGGIISIGAAANIGTGDLNFTAAGTGLTLTGTAMTLANNFVLGNVSGNITLLTPNSSATTINGVISGGGTNTVLFFQGGGQSQNSGALTLNGINTFQGTLNVQRGPLILGNSSAAGSAIIKLDSNDNANGSLQFSSSFTVSNAVNLFDTGEKIGVATSQTNTLSGVISGSNGFEKVGGGTLALTNTNTYTGTTLVSAGTLQVSGGSAIVDTGTVTTANVAGAVFQLAANETIGTLSGGGSTGGRVDLQSNTLTVGAGTFAGEVSGTGGLTKNTSGTLTLTGTSSYTGSTTVSAGVLQVNGTLANTTTTVNAGTLGGTGTIGGSVTLNNAATIAAGASPGSLELGGNLSLGTNTTTAIELGGTNFTLNGTEDYDRIKLTSSSAVLTLGGTLNLSLVNSFTLAENQSFGIFQLDALGFRSGTFTGLGTDGSLVGNFGGIDLFITYSGDFGDSGTVATFGGNDIVLYTVPEPSSALLGGLGLLALLRRRR